MTLLKRNGGSEKSGPSTSEVPSASAPGTGTVGKKRKMRSRAVRSGVPGTDVDDIAPVLLSSDEEGGLADGNGVLNMLDIMDPNGAAASCGPGGAKDSDDSEEDEEDPMAESLERMGDSYFRAYNKKTKSKVTSDQTMESLKVPGDVEAREIVAQLPSKNVAGRMRLCKGYESKFAQYRFWLRNDFNLIFFGLGSKLSLLERLAQFLDDGTPDGAGDVVVVNGFSPHLSIKEILNTLSANVAKLSKSEIGKSNIDHACAIAKVISGSYPNIFGKKSGSRFSAGNEGVTGRAGDMGGRGGGGASAGSGGVPGGARSRRSAASGRVGHGPLRPEDIMKEAAHAIVDKRPSRRLYLVVHNLDGPSLRSPEVQEVLSFLSEGRGVHVIASIDHLNASYLWDQRVMQRFNWVWNDVTTFSPYNKETEYEEAIVGGAGTNAARGAAFVLKSLTPNHRDILRLLAQFQLDHPAAKGLDFADFYSRCRNEMLVNSDQTLRHHLTEFMDHALVSTTKGADGKEYYFISLKDEAIRSVILSSK
jgi:hypothetical protein